MTSNLPPMLAAPSTAHMAALARERKSAKRRATLDRKSAYRQAMLCWTAAALENPEAMPKQPAAAQFDLTPEQGAVARRDLARVLRHRANAHDGRIRV